MERGDLELWERPTIVVVIEGVLCDVATFQEKRRFRRPQTVGWNVSWHDLPLKRLKVLKHHWSHVGQEYVSFISQDFVDTVAPYLEATRTPYDAVVYHGFNVFCDVLRYRTEIQAVYDSDPDRLQRYGQKGIGVLKGEDFG